MGDALLLAIPCCPSLQWSCGGQIGKPALSVAIAKLIMTTGTMLRCI